MVFLLHVVGCIYAIAAQIVSENEETTWIETHGIADASISEKYVTSCYWAVVTISTVGYGDITPTNEPEVLVTIILVFLGVSMYSYIISRLTKIFSQVG